MSYYKEFLNTLKKDKDYAKTLEALLEEMKVIQSDIEDMISENAETAKESEKLKEYMLKDIEEADNRKKVAYANYEKVTKEVNALRAETNNKIANMFAKAQEELNIAEKVLYDATAKYKDEFEEDEDDISLAQLFNLMLL